MKYLFLILVSIFLFGCGSNNPQEIVVKEYVLTSINTTDENGFDSIRAKKDGADQYGMRQYVMAFLKRGPNRDLDSTTAANLQQQHMDNIGKMAEENKLALAGPFLDDGELRGIYIFNVTTIEEAELLTNSDPAIIAGSLIMELKPWYGSAALFEVNDIHNSIAKIKF